MKTKILAMLLITIMLCGCASSVEADCDYKISEANSIGNTRVNISNYTDPETGVCYLIYNENYYANRSGITVRYNADGSIMTKGDLND